MNISHRTGSAAVLASVAILGLGAASCGEDDGGDVRSVGSGSASASGSGSGSGSASATTDAECSPVGVDLEADATETVKITLVDHGFEPDAVEVAAGTVTFEVTNDGKEAHELAILPGGGDVPMTDEGAPDEDALAEAGAFELEAFGPGQTCNATWVLEPGTYTMFCIVEAADGKTHVDKGMQGTLTVT